MSPLPILFAVGVVATGWRFCLSDVRKGELKAYLAIGVRRLTRRKAKVEDAAPFGAETLEAMEECLPP